MEKYGVLEEPVIKTSSVEQIKCPVCGSTLEKAESTNVLKCPKCGTLPFEGSSNER